MPDESHAKVMTVMMEQNDNYQFLVDFGSSVSLLMDEPEPIGDGVGPNASKVLSAAIGNCLTASLLFCLQKSRVEILNMKTRIDTTIYKNDKGRLRIKGSKVKMITEFGDEVPTRMKKCLELFEKFCTVSSSVREGISIEVEVEDQNGRQLFISKN